jgi:C-terminal processing protease CtpA/Prc
MKHFLHFLQIIFNSIACDIGLKDRDFIVDINGTKVFEMSHDECTAFIKKAGNQLNLKIERFF